MRRKSKKRVEPFENIDREFYETIQDLLEHPMVLKMKDYPHHCNTSCYQHCLNVSYYNYRICKQFGLNGKAAARAGMLHDMFLYNWRGYSKRTGDHFHAMTHPRKALNNASKYFTIDELEQEIILKHMWPLTVIPPFTAEAFIISLTDKYCGICEIAEFYCERLIPGRFSFLFGKIHVKW